MAYLEQPRAGKKRAGLLIRPRMQAQLPYLLAVKVANLTRLLKSETISHQLKQVSEFTFFHKMVLSEEEIQKYWRNSSFAGSFSPSGKFFRALKLIDPTVTRGQVLRALANIKTYQQHLGVPLRLKQRRHLRTRGVGLDLSADLFEMDEVRGYKFGLMIVDEFNYFMYSTPLMDKSSASVKKEFEEIFQKNPQLKPSYISTDQGGEFLGNQEWLAEKHILLLPRRGQNKASPCTMVI